MGFVLMFDLTSEPTFVNIRGWLTTLRTHAYCERPDVVLIGNKLDLADGARGLRAVPNERAAQLARQYEYVPLPFSAPLRSTQLARFLRHARTRLTSAVSALPVRLSFSRYSRHWPH